MAKQNRQIFLLGTPKVALPEQKPIPAFCFYLALTVLSCAASFGCFYTAFGISLRAAPMVLFGGLFVLASVINSMLPKHRGLISSALWVIWGLLVYWQFEPLYQGFVVTANTAIYVYADCLDTVLPIFALPAGFSAAGSDTVTLLAVFLLFPVTRFYSWLLVRRSSTLGAFCVSGIFLLVPLLISVLPAVWALGLMLVFWMFLLMACSSLGKRRLFSEDHGRFQISGRAFISPVTLLLLPALAVSLFAIYKLCPPKTHHRPDLINDLRTTVTRGMNIPAMLKGGTGSGNSSVDLSSLGDRVYSGKTALKVKHEFDEAFVGSMARYTFQKDYLKSFSGSVYTGHSWEKLDNGQANAVNDLLGEVKAQRLPYLLNSDFPCPADSAVSYDLSVEKVNADPRCFYVPCGLNTLSPEGDWVADSFIKSRGFFSGPAAYDLSARIPPQFEGNSLLDRLSGWTDHGSYTLSGEDLEQIESGGTITIRGEDGKYSSLFAEMKNELPTSGEQEDSFYPERYRLPDWALDELPLNGRQRELIDTVQNYTEFVYDTYTQLPEDATAFAKEYLTSHGLPLSPSVTVKTETAEWDISGDTMLYRFLSQVDNGYYDAAMAIKSLLGEECRYSLSPDQAPAEKDFVRYFLNDSKEGYCVHFATAEVVLLRAMGIPARYAEGYVAPVDKSGGWVEVTDRNSHAWVEIYFSGAGWLPFEATPAGPNAPAACENGISPTEADDLPPDMLTPSPGAEPTPPPRNPTTSTAPRPTPRPLERKTWATPRPTAAPTDGTADYTLLIVLLSIVGGLLAIFPLIWLIRKLRIGIRKLSFRQKDRNRAALKIYAHLVRLYQANYVLPDGTTSPSEDIEELALKARFSQHAITQEEVQKLLDHAAMMEKRLDEGLASRPRLRCKYLQALF